MLLYYCRCHVCTSMLSNLLRIPGAATGVDTRGSYRGGYGGGIPGAATVVIIIVFDVVNVVDCLSQHTALVQ